MIKLYGVVEKLAPDSAFYSICEADLGPTLANLGELLAEKALFSPCEKQ